jgi:SPX domain protein involved in polyphosphate accumulation
MKFGKNLFRVAELSDPEWGPFWMNYKFLKKKINDIVLEQGGKRQDLTDTSKSTSQLEESQSEIEFFKVLKFETKKTSSYFTTLEQLYQIRHARMIDSYQLIRDNEKQEGRFDRSCCTRLLSACVKFYKDVLLLENFAIMNYCGFSKILKKHDKLTG